MNSLLLASHDALDHVLPHRFGKPLFHWNVNWTSPLDIVSFTPHDTWFTNQILMTIVAAVIMLLVFPMIGRRYTAMIAGGPERSVPTGFTNLLEAMMQFIRNDVARPVLADKTDRFLPFLWTVFFYILICNLLGMIPLDSIIYLISGGKLQHIGGTATGNIMITAGLALCAFLMIHYSGAKEVYSALVTGTYGHHHHEEHGHDEGHGHGHHGHHHAHGGMSPPAALIMSPLLYIWNFGPHVFAMHEPRSKPSPAMRIIMIPLYVVFLAVVMKYGALLFGDIASQVAMYMGLVLGFIAGACAGGVHPTDFLDSVMWVILLILEGIGAVIKPFALAIRLFANMVAGHVVLASILGLIFAFEGSVSMNYGMGIISSLGAAALSCLELFVCFLQAYVFVFLTTLFIGASVSPEH